jgi:Zn-dependent M16 (insulinase) family peptidase
LHPNCIRDPQIFAQEGWHLELEDPSQPLTYKGVVFNEMKGVYSSPDSVNGRVTQNVLFPDTSYAKDSGGDPADIPDLTFDEFKAFYESYYHPSNARFWFYGDDPADERLRLLSVYLDEFDAREVDSTVYLQKLWNQPKKVVEKYSVGESDESMDEEPKSFVSLNWLLTEEPLDLETELGLGFLNYLMLGTSASPLRKALTDSGLGESLIGGGVEDELCQPIFSIGLKGVKQEDAGKVEDLVMETLERLEKEGFAESAIEAAINTIEFSLRENNTGRFPRGLSLMLRAMSGWIYDRDPFRPMKWQDDLAAFKARLESGEDVFSPLIRKFLIDNNHRVTVELHPDESLGKQLEDAEKARLERERQAIGEDGISGVIEATRVLKEKQETPDAPEALSCVPSLSVADIPKMVTPVPTTVSTSASGVTTLSHEIFTNDVVYLDVAFDLKTVPQELIHLVPLFCRSLTQMGTDKESFVELTERIGRKTGGISVSPFVSAGQGLRRPDRIHHGAGKDHGRQVTGHAGHRQGRPAFCQARRQGQVQADGPGDAQLPGGWHHRKWSQLRRNQAGRAIWRGGLDRGGDGRHLVPGEDQGAGWPRRVRLGGRHARPGDHSFSRPAAKRRHGQSDGRRGCPHGC